MLKVPLPGTPAWADHVACRYWRPEHAQGPAVFQGRAL